MVVYEGLGDIFSRGGALVTAGSSVGGDSRWLRWLVKTTIAAGSTTATGPWECRRKMGFFSSFFFFNIDIIFG